MVVPAKWRTRNNDNTTCCKFFGKLILTLPLWTLILKMIFLFPYRIILWNRDITAAITSLSVIFSCCYSRHHHLFLNSIDNFTWGTPTVSVFLACLSATSYYMNHETQSANDHFIISLSFSKGRTRKYKKRKTKIISRCSPFSSVSTGSCLIFRSEWELWVGVVASLDDKAVSVDDWLFSL